MAHTKRKRRSKHRGTPTGRIEARGRTGRKPKDDEVKKSSGSKRQDRFDKPPNWRSAATRALVAVVIFFVAVVFLFKQSVPAAAGLSAFMLIVYIPMGYYTDLWMYNRRQKQKAAAAAGTKKES